MGDKNHPKHESLGSFLASLNEVLKSVYRNREGWRRMDKRLREAVFLAVSVKNRCRFCFTVHTRLARKAGMTKEEIAAIVREDLSPFDEKTRSAIEFATRMRNDGGKTSSETLSSLTKRFNTTEAGAVESAVKFIIFANKFFNIFFSPLDLEKAESITDG